MYTACDSVLTTGQGTLVVKDQRFLLQFVIDYCALHDKLGNMEIQPEFNYHWNHMFFFKFISNVTGLIKTCHSTANTVIFMRQNCVRIREAAIKVQVSITDRLGWITVSRHTISPHQIAPAWFRVVVSSPGIFSVYLCI